MAFWPHWLYHSLVIGAAMVEGSNARSPTIVLGHSPQTALKSYNRASKLDASRRHEVAHQ